MGKKRKKPTMMMLLIRIVVGGYLIYLAHSLITDIGSSDYKKLMFVFAVLFVFAGILLIILSARSFITKDYANPFDADEDEDDSEDISKQLSMDIDEEETENISKQLRMDIDEENTKDISEQVSEDKDADKDNNK